MVKSSKGEDARGPEVQRSVLPIPDRPYLGVRPLNAKDPSAIAN